MTLHNQNQNLTNIIELGKNALEIAGETGTNMDGNAKKFDNNIALLHHFNNEAYSAGSRVDRMLSREGALKRIVTIVIICLTVSVAIVVIYKLVPKQ